MSHQNFTAKADAIVQLFKTEKIVRCSATPLQDKSARLIEVTEPEVIAEGLIKKRLVINENFPQAVETDDQTAFLLEAALKKQVELRGLLEERKADVNPLIIVQLPNNSDLLLDSVERFFASKGISCEAGTLAVWLSGRHENLEGISEKRLSSAPS